MSDISAPALWSCLDYHINYYVQILHFISLYSCPFHPLLCCVDAFVLWVMIIVYIANHIYLQSVPKNAYSSTTSWAANWHWKAMYPQTRFPKTAFQRVRFFGTPCISSWSTSALCEYDDFRSWHSLLEGHDDVDEEKMKMSMVMRLTSPIGILAKAYLPSLAIAALLLRRRRKKYCLPGLSWAFMFTIDWQFFRFYMNKISHGCPQAAEVVLNAKSRKLFWILSPCEESAAHRADSRRLFLGTIEERKLG